MQFKAPYKHNWLCGIMVKAVQKWSGYPGLKPHFCQNSFCWLNLIRRRFLKKLNWASQVLYLAAMWAKAAFSISVEAYPSILMLLSSDTARSLACEKKYCFHFKFEIRKFRTHSFRKLQGKWKRIDVMRGIYCWYPRHLQLFLTFKLSNTCMWYFFWVLSLSGIFVFVSIRAARGLQYLF